MNYGSTKIDFLQVNRSDTFHITLEIGGAYQITNDTRIQMIVRASGDIPEAPVLHFDSDTDDITIDGQRITFHKEPEDMTVRVGKFFHEIHFTKNNITNVLYRGIFEVLSDSTKNI
jgi:hypothetical protein